MLYVTGVSRVFASGILLAVFISIYPADLICNGTLTKLRNDVPMWHRVIGHFGEPNSSIAKLVSS
ncbi:hypothetical protein OROMI_024605 [Orobanche minor]